MEAIETIQNDIACPNCNYNLRGLHGDVVTCPECGQICDIAEIVILRWTKPWHRAPGLTRLYLPTVWLMFAGWGVAGVFGLGSRVDLTTRLLVTGIFVAVYAASLAFAWRVFKDIEAIWLALLSHLILACYLASVPLAFWAASRLAAPPPYQFALGLTIGVGGVGIGYAGERLVASRCIRQYLRRKPTS